MDMTEWTATVEESFTNSLKLLGTFFPKILGALALLIAGVIIGRVLATGTAKILALIGTDRLLSRTAMQTVLERTGTRRTVSQILGTIVFWIIFLLFLISATETLGLAIVSEALTGLAYFLPKVGLAIVILILGLLAANFLKEVISLACTTAGIPQGPVVAQTFYVGLTLLVVVTAINELGIDTTLLNNTIMILFAGLIGGAALSFGLGARTAVANLIASHYLQPVLRVGQKVHVGTLSGEVISITPIAVVLQTPDGRAVIPASQFSETHTLISESEKTRAS